MANKLLANNLRTKFRWTKFRGIIPSSGWEWLRLERVGELVPTELKHVAHRQFLALPNSNKLLKLMLNFQRKIKAQTIMHSTILNAFKVKYSIL